MEAVGGETDCAEWEHQSHGGGMGFILRSVLTGEKADGEDPSAGSQQSVDKTGEQSPQVQRAHLPDDLLFIVWIDRRDFMHEKRPPKIRRSEITRSNCVFPAEGGCRHLPAGSLRPVGQRRSLRERDDRGRIRRRWLCEVLPRSR